MPQWLGRHKWLFLVAAVMVPLLAFAACGDDEEEVGETPAVGEEGPLKLGVLVAFTGDLSDFGPAHENAARLAAQEINGLFHPKSPGYPLGSPLALHLMFGYPEEEFPDRGPLLAAARGLEIPDGAVVLAARFASVVREKDGLL
ncbi:hypothetical protein LCGC14_2892340, partial [marine sediment metagenome]